MDLVTHKIKLLHKWADSLVELELTQRDLDDVTSAQAYVLAALIDMPSPPSQKALADALGMDRMTTLGVVRRLETHGFTTRERSGREILLKLTDAGVHVAHAAQDALLAAQRVIHEIMPELEAGLTSFSLSAVARDIENK
jgi:DNA-binding MarR family transcriptional regulator